MPVLPIVTYDDDVLRQEAQPVNGNSPELQQLIDDMLETMYNADGVGLAAPQIGQLKRIFVADVDVYTETDEAPQQEQYGPLVMINPEITDRSSEEVSMDEGCLSIPEVNGAVNRPEQVTITFLDRDFNRQEMSVGSNLARVIQHEYDHLNGVLFLDHLSYFKRKMLSKKLSALAEGRTDIAYPVAKKANAKSTAE